jgi:DNA-binding FadR family transcriptional regulator
VLADAIAQFDSHLNFIRSVTLKDTALRRQIVNRQSKIRDAVQRRDKRRAESLWRAYLNFTEEVLTDTAGPHWNDEETGWDGEI